MTVDWDARTRAMDLQHERTVFEGGQLHFSHPSSILHVRTSIALSLASQSLAVHPVRAVLMCMRSVLGVDALL